MSSEVKDAESSASRPPGKEPRARGRTARRIVVAVLLVLLAVGLEWAIRAGEPTTAPTAGVDTLVMPWHEPSPSEFVATVEHAWWPLEPGARWEYAALSGTGETTAKATLTVLDEPVQVAGISATAVRWALDDQPPSTLFVAQDRRGHLWLLGVEAGRLTPSWSIADGRPAGLLLPADPRRGDGYGLVHDRDGAVLAKATVQGISGPGGGAQPVSVPLGEYEEVLRMQWSKVASSTGGFPVQITTVMAQGVGPVVITPSTSQPLRLVDSSFAD